MLQYIILFSLILSGFEAAGSKHGSPVLGKPISGHVVNLVTNENAIPDSGRRAGRLVFSLQDETGLLELKGFNDDVIRTINSLTLDQAAWRDFMPVFTGEKPSLASDNQPAMLGDYKVVNHGIHFRPRFPFRAGMHYVAQLKVSKLQQLLDLEIESDEPAQTFAFHIPDLQRTPVTFVEQIYPTADVLPENALKVYIYFSAPMSSDDAYRHVRLLHADGREVELPFVEVERGLWNPAHTRLTLFFHPGRIKRGVGPNLVMGPILRAGERYRLVVDNEWRDAQGLPLREGFVKEFDVVEADRTSPVYTKWQLQAPAGGSKAALQVDLNEPLDHALLQRFLSVIRNDETIDGTIAVLDHQTRWVFHPYKPWVPGNYYLLLNPALEDLSGNRLDGLFDAEINSAASDSAHFKLAFEVMN